MEELKGILSLAERFGVANVLALLAVSAVVVHGRDDLRQGLIWAGEVIQGCLIWTGRVAFKPLVRQWLQHRDERHRLDLHIRAERHHLQQQLREQRLRESLDRNATERALRDLAERSLPGAASGDPEGSAATGGPAGGSATGTAASAEVSVGQDGDGSGPDLDPGVLLPTAPSERP